MKIKILGNGGAINDGLPYNAFVIDHTILVETPPDIIASLFREHISISSIDEIYISHFHGDHSFGFPFLALRLFWEEMKGNQRKEIKLYAPHGGKEFLIDLTARALSGEHPCISWIEEHIAFNSLFPEKEIRLRSYSVIPIRMDHFTETYGFILNKRDVPIFAYIADTKWSENVEKIIEISPPIILLDLNGEPDDPVPIHLSEEELIQRGFMLAHAETVFYGTHLKFQKKSNSDKIVYASPGMEIEV